MSQENRSRPKSTSLLRTRRDLILLSATLLAGAALSTLAHEVIVTPTRSGDYNVNVGGRAHAEHDVVDFGDSLVGTTLTRAVTLTSVSRREVTIEPASTSELTVTPSQFVLSPAGEPGDGATLQLSFTSSQAGPIADLELIVNHEGVASSATDRVELDGEVHDPETILPAELDLGMYMVGTPISVEVLLTNPTAWAVTVTPQLPLEPGLVITPSELTLEPAGVLGSARSFVIQAGSSSAAVYSGQMDFDVVFDGVAGSRTESMSYTGEVIDPLDLVTNTLPLDFGTILPGDEVTLPLTLTNPNAFPVDVLAPGALPQGMTTVPFADPLAVPQNNGTSTYLVTAAPNGGGPFSQTLSFEVTVAGVIGSAPLPVPVVGVGYEPVYTSIATPRGFRPNQPFQFGEIDSVDTASGNVTLRIPLGQVYEVGPMISYQFTAVNNSNAWDFIPVPCPDGDPGCTENARANFAVPNIGSNAGLGWELHFGKLYAHTPPSGLDAANRYRWPNHPNNVDVSDHGSAAGGSWLYIAPDGARHSLHALAGRDNGTATRPKRYSKDGSFLRMVQQPDNSTTHVEHPDGRISVFEKTDEWMGTDFCGNGIAGCWRLKEIKDPFGNKVTITYHYASAEEIESWVVKDSTDRQHVIRFDTSIHGTAGGDGHPDYSTDEDDEWGDLRRVVSKVELAAFDGSNAVYDFNYATHTIGRSCPPTANTLLLTSDLEIRTRVLTKIEVPESQPWVFTTNTSGSTACGGDIRGKVTQVTLPTRGKIQYSFSDSWETPTRCDYSNQGDNAAETFYFASGITSKKRLKPNGTVESVWSYSTDIFPEPSTLISAGANCTRSKYRMTTVDGPKHPSAGGGRHTKTVTYHGIWEGPRNPQGNESGTGWQITDKGLPYTKSDSTGGDGLDRLFLSKQIYECTGADCVKRRSVYRRYTSEFRGICNKFDGQGDSPGCFQVNALQLAERTAYHDDSPGGVTRWVENRNSLYDGVGHFRVRKTEDNFAGSVTTRTVTTQYSATNQSIDPITSTGYINPGSPSSYLPDKWILSPYTKVTKSADGETYVTETKFDRGVLQCSRRWKNSGARSSKDVVVSLTLGSNEGTNAGLPITEKVSGGELANITGPTACSVDTTTTDGRLYTFVHTYEDLQLASTRVDGFPYRYRADINQNTGLPAVVYNEADEAETLTFDDLGRLTTITPEASRHEATTVYTYANPSGANPSMKVEREDGGTVLTEETTIYDHFGRPVEHKIVHPDGTTSNAKTEYDFAGRVFKKTTRQANGSFDSGKAWTYGDFDAFDRPRSVTAPDGSVTTKSYSGVREETSTVQVFTITGTGTTGFKDQKTITVRDGWGRTITSRIEGAHETRFEVDPDGQVIEATRISDENQVREYGYDGRGYLVWERHPEINGTVSYTPDAIGLPRRLTDDRRDLSFEYDLDGRLELVREAQPDGRLLKTFAYGAGNDGTDLVKGRLKTAARYNYPPGREAVAIFENYEYRGGTAGPSRTQRQVHWLDRPGNDRFGATHRTSFGYDKLGNLASLTYPHCVQNGTSQGSTKPCATGGDDIQPPSHTMSWEYTQGLMTKASSSHLPPTDPVATFTYHPNLQLATADIRNGVLGTYDQGTNGMTRPSRRHFAKGSTVLFDTGSYAYDPAGNIRAIGADVYTYDKGNRLTSATVKAAGEDRFANYTYDRADNLQSVETDLFFGLRSFNVDPGTNRLLGTGSGTDWVHDEAGNLTSAASGTFEFSWDPLNMQTMHNGPTGEYVSVYGPGEYRAWVEDPDGALHWTSRGPDGKILREFTVTGNGDAWTFEKDFIYGAEGILAAHHRGGAQRYFHTDHLGTARLFTGADGDALSLHHYYPFGREAFPDGVGPGDLTDESSVKFTGHQRELHNESDYMLGRHYFLFTSRFGSVDPARDGWNLYAYVGNSPIGNIDPTGFSDEPIIETEEHELQFGLQFTEGFGVKFQKTLILGDPVGESGYEAKKEFSIGIGAVGSVEITFAQDVVVGEIQTMAAGTGGVASYREELAETSERKLGSLRFGLMGVSVDALESGPGVSGLRSLLNSAEVGFSIGVGQSRGAVLKLRAADAADKGAAMRYERARKNKFTRSDFQ